MLKTKKQARYLITVLRRLVKKWEKRGGLQNGLCYQVAVEGSCTERWKQLDMPNDAYAVVDWLLSEAESGWVAGRGEYMVISGDWSARGYMCLFLIEWITTEILPNLPNAINCTAVQSVG